MALKQLKIEVNNAVFSLPYHVALQEGFFRDEGVDVVLVPAGSGRDRDDALASACQGTQSGAG